MEYIIILVLLVLAVRFGWWMHSIWLAYIIREEPERLQETIRLAQKLKAIAEVEDGKTPEKGIRITVERVGEVLYAYTTDTNQFIAQGTDLKSLLESAHKRFPNKIFFGDIPADDPAKELV